MSYRRPITPEMAHYAAIRAAASWLYESGVEHQKNVEAYTQLYLLQRGTSTTRAIAKSESRKPPPKTTHYRVTLFRSPIGLEKRRHDSLFSLGLRRRMDVVYHRHSPDAAGLILSVKEILKVENVTEQEYRLGKLSSRKLVEDDRGLDLLETF
ncbi:hypothetical protein PSTT_13871 [Puccinia striiformis]|uniref:Large ribosomal subunit protein uL30-like ferredoxin-like fold domain-containing protein n=1 Tax=Puccinia striiformis TaxID=27350 RepID=A0A2S4UPX9_9BASI|nr:hypothetical protein PSTT_13871 [Puccinia striiformis]